MLGSENLSISVRIATVVVPVAVYFLILGLLNSRKHPQLISGRLDFALLIAVLSPLFVLPALNYVGISLWSVLAAVAAVAGGIMLVAPRGPTWVIYNMPAAHARQAIADALGALGLGCTPVEGDLHLADQRAVVHISSFTLLRNVSIRLRGGSEQLARRFEAALSQRLASVHAETTPTAIGLLLVATAMMVAPLTLMAHRVPEIVRILTDLLY